MEILNGSGMGHVAQPRSLFGKSRNSYVAHSTSVRLDALENYIRGVLETTPTERTRRLKEALRISPDYSAGTA